MLKHDIRNLLISFSTENFNIEYNAASKIVESYIESSIVARRLSDTLYNNMYKEKYITYLKTTMIPSKILTDYIDMVIDNIQVKLYAVEHNIDIVSYDNFAKRIVIEDIIR